MEKNRDPEKKSHKKFGLATAAAMFASLAGGAHAESSVAGLDNETKHLRKENNLLSFSKGEIKRLEGAIEADSLPLTLQVKFMQEALRADGPFALELSNMKLTRERLSQIHSLADKVSARLTVAYTDWKKHPELDEHFKEADKLREATSILKVQRNGKTEFCNKFNIREGDEVFSVTAFHCIKDSILESEYHRPAYTDIAVRFLPKELWELNGIQNVARLPGLDHRANRYAISGRVVTAFSRSMGNEPKVHFSFAMPLPLNKELIFNKNSAQKLTALGAEDWMMFFKPYSEGQRNPETGKINAAGSSGGPVAIEGYGITGTTSATAEITDQCSKTCHASSFFTVDVLAKAISEERTIRQKP